MSKGDRDNHNPFPFGKRLNSDNSHNVNVESALTFGPSTPEEYISILGSQFGIRNVPPSLLAHTYMFGPNDYKPNTPEWGKKMADARDKAIEDIQKRFYDTQFELDIQQWEAKTNSNLTFDM